MNPLIKKLMDEVNIDEAIASKVIDVVANFVEDKLPSPANSLASNAIKGVDAENIVDGAMDKISSLF